MNIPFVDLKLQYLSIKPEIDEAISDVISSSSFIKGPFLAKFEEEFASFVSAKFCVGLANGTDALSLGLKALGIKAGDEVITVPNTFIATTEAISSAGARIVFCDVEEDTYLMDMSVIDRFVTERTKAIIPVHLYGNTANLKTLKEYCEPRGIHILSDGAQAHGAKVDGKDLVEFSDIVAYSFYPGKNLGAYGDGGAIVTNDETFANRVKMLANHGRTEKYIHQFEGINSRLDGMQAAILSAKLKCLDGWNESRRNIAKIYDEGFADCDEVTPTAVRDNVIPVYHLYVIRVPQKDRDNLNNHLKQKGIHTGIHYPVPLPFQPAYKGLGIDTSAFEYTNTISKEIISLPMFPEMTEEQICYVVDSVKEHFQEAR